MELPAGFITDPEKKVQGVALYAEFKNEYNQTLQLFLTPDGVTESGKYQHARAYYRRLSPSQPKKQWKGQNLQRGLLSAENVADEAWREHRVSTLEFLMKRVSISSTLVGKPFFVEVSKKDLEDIWATKTPTKVVHRIGQSRTALNYPDMFTA